MHLTLNLQPGAKHKGALSRPIQSKKDMNMKMIKALLLFVVVFSISPAPVHATDLQDEIFGLKWGEKLPEENLFSKIWSSSHVDFYRKPGEVRTINDVVVPDVIYGFYSGQFFAVYIKIDSIEVFDDLRRYMKEKYGVPKKSMDVKNDLTIYRWRYKDIKTKLKLYGKSNYMKLAFYYTPLSNKVNEAQEEKLQKKSFRFLPIEKDKKPAQMPLLEF